MKRLAKGIHRLTDREVRTAKAPALIHDGAGLYLQCSEGVPNADGSPGPVRRSWVLRFTINGRRREMGLGPLEAVPLATARDQADAARQLARIGKDPIEHRKQRKAEAAAEAARKMTFREAAEAYVKAKGAEWRSDKHRKLWEASLEAYAHKTLGALPVEAVGVNHVLAVLEPIWTKKTETAGRIRQRIEVVLDWASARDLRDGENPARWARLKHTLPSRATVRPVVHRPALPYADLPAFMAQLQTVEGLGAQALRLTILCATRTAETLQAPWAEIDLDAALWTIPAARMKAQRDHRIPLSSQAVELLRDLRAAHPRSKFAFPGVSVGRPLSGMAMLMTLRRMKRPDGKAFGDSITVHGFRSTFKDWAADCTSFPREVAEAALAHVLGDKTEAAYRRGDALEKRRRLMQAWADYADKQDGATVIELRRGKGKA